MTPEQSEIYGSLLTWVGRTTTKKAIRRVGDKSIAISTDIGSVRAENQDKCLVMRKGNSDGKKLLVAVLCDGMGGMESGADCASKAISTFVNYCAYSINTPIKQMLDNAVRKANETIYAEYQGRGGATLSGFAIDSNGNLTGVNVGDSRVYSYDEKELKQISSDDTLEGQLGDGSSVYTGRKELLQHVGIGSDIKPHILSIDTKNNNDKNLFLCTDGIHYLGHNLLDTIIANSIEPAVAALRLTELSQWCGGKDNASSIVTSSFEELLQFRNIAKPNVLEVWDPFGEIQFHYKTQELSNSKIDPQDDISKNIKVVKKTRKRKSKAKKSADLFEAENINTEKESPEKKPELEIEFKNYQGE